MKATGIVRRMDELGRLVIPKEICRTFGINPGDPLEIFTEDDGHIVLRKFSIDGQAADAAKLIQTLTADLPPAKAKYIRELADEIIDVLKEAK
jgi:AbrB family transcriptional regulator, stage V sporulation protein T